MWGRGIGDGSERAVSGLDTGRNDGKDGPTDLQRQIEGVLCGISRRPEFKVVTHLHRKRRQLGDIHALEIQVGAFRPAEGGQILEVVCMWNRLIAERKESLEVLLGCLLGVEARGIVRTLSVQDPTGGGDIAFGLEEPATGVTVPIRHTAPVLRGGL